MTQGYTKRSSFQYHEPGSVAYSDHSLVRHVQRLDFLTEDETALVMERAVAAAAHPKNQDHTGVRILTAGGRHVWAVVSGRTVRTIMATDEGTHLDAVSPCNRYALVA